jgi:APA family basic amino acid/polyamine antiporter
VKTGAGVSSAVLLLVFGSLLLIVGFGLTSGHANISGAFSFKTSDNSSVSFSAVFTAMLAAFWAYQGWASVGFVGGEIKEANKNIPRGIVIGIFSIIAIYLLVNTTYLSLLPVQNLEQIYDGGKGNRIPAVEAVRIFWGAYGAVFISVLIAVTTLGCTNATILTSSRVYYAMAKEKVFFPKVSKLNDKQVPSNSLLYQCVWACLLVLSGTFEQITNMIIFAVFIYYGATALGVFILRRKMPDATRPYKVWGYPIVPAIVILFCGVLFFNTIYAKPVEAAVGMGLMLTGVPMWFWFNRKGGVVSQEP